MMSNVRDSCLRRGSRLLIFSILFFALAAPLPSQTSELIEILELLETGLTKVETGLTKLDSGLSSVEKGLEISEQGLIDLRLSFDDYRKETERTIKRMKRTIVIGGVVISGGVLYAIIRGM